MWVNNVMILINLGTILVSLRIAAMLFGTPDTSYIGKKTDKSSSISIYILGILCFLGGIFGEQTMDFLFGVQKSISPYGFVEKLLILAGSWVVGIIVYKFVLARDKNAGFFGRIRSIDLNFRGICASIGIFFVVILAVIGFVY